MTLNELKAKDIPFSKDYAKADIKVTYNDVEITMYRMDDYRWVNKRMQRDTRFVAIYEVNGKQFETKAETFKELKEYITSDID